MARKNKNTVGQPSLLEAPVSSAPCVPDIRDAVKAWRDGVYTVVVKALDILGNDTTKTVKVKVK